MSHPAERAKHRKKTVRIREAPTPTIVDVKEIQRKRSKRRRQRANRERRRREAEQAARLAKRREREKCEREEERRKQVREAQLDEERMAQEVLQRKLQPARNEGTIVGTTSRRRKRQVTRAKQQHPGLPDSTKAQPADNKRLSREEQSARLATNNQLGTQLATLLGKKSSSTDADGCKSKGDTKSSDICNAHKSGKGHKPKNGRFVTLDDPARRLGGASSNFRGDIKAEKDDILEGAFETATPSFQREEDGSRYMGHSFRDVGGEFGSMPMYDDYDE